MITVGGPQDFASIQNPDFFDYQAEQKYASYNDGFAADVQQQIDLAVSYFYILLIQKKGILLNHDTDRNGAMWSSINFPFTGGTCLPFIKDG